MYVSTGPIVLTVPEASAQAIEDSSVAPAYEYSASMPVVSGLDPTIADPVNGQIRRLYQAWIDANISAASADAEGRTYGLEIDQKVTLATEQLLSLGVWSTYNSCAASAEGAHASAMTCDLTDWSLLGLDDLLSYPEILFALSELSAQALIDAGWYSPKDQSAFDLPGLGQDLSNFDGLALGGGGVEITFDKYQVGPGAMEAPTTTISYAELADLIGPDSPVIDLVKR